MRLVFLGTGGSIPTVRRPTTGAYLPEFGILLDAGSNTFGLREHHRSGPLTVLMSHYHLDHSAGLMFLSAGLFHDRDVTIEAWGPAWSDRLEGMLGPNSPLWPIPLGYPLRVAPPEFSVAGLTIRTISLPHSAPVLGYRLSAPDGRSLAYVTDTTAPGDYEEFLRGVDVLIHECSFTREKADLAARLQHSSAAEVGRLARRAGVGTLYLTHVGPGEDAIRIWEQVKEEFPNTVLPVEGQEYPRSTSVDPRVAIFPGSFDPLTVGHVAIIQTCTRMFQQLHVVVARNPGKDATASFTVEERVALIRRCVPGHVQVSAWEGLTVEYARRMQAGCIVRGLGRAEDYFGEVRLWKTNALLEPEIRTVWVPPNAENLDVSSSMIKEASRFGGWKGVAHLVPEPIREDVGRRLRGD